MALDSSFAIPTCGELRRIIIPTSSFATQGSDRNQFYMEDATTQVICNLMEIGIPISLIFDENTLPTNLPQSKQLGGFMFPVYHSISISTISIIYFGILFDRESSSVGTKNPNAYIISLSRLKGKGSSSSLDTLMLHSYTSTSIF